MKAKKIKRKCQKKKKKKFLTDTKKNTASCLASNVACSSTTMPTIWLLITDLSTNPLLGSHSQTAHANISV